MNRRERALQALGLTPLWVPRGHLPAPVSVDASADSEGFGEHGAVQHSTVEQNTTPDARLHLAAGQTSAQPLPADARTAAISRMDWAELRAATAQCTACPLHQGRKQAVLGVGDPRAEWLFIGEGPGAEEDARGEPFVGQAGKLLDNMLAAIALRRGENVYIANVVKCRPPGNRTPQPAEASACAPFLARQIALIAPKLIVALGKVAANHLLETDATLGSLRGKVHDCHGLSLIATYHPAYLLRNMTDKAKAWEDLCFAVEAMSRLKSAHPAPI